MSEAQTTAPSETAPHQEDPAPAVKGYVSLLRNHGSLRNLWMGRAVSFIGDWFNVIALFESVQRITDSAVALTLVLVAKTLPAFIITPLVGPIVDRVDRRKLLMAADMFRALCSFGLIAAHLFDWLPGLYLVTVFMVCGTSIGVPASNAALPMILPPSRVPMANALMGGTWSISLAGGAALGGAVTAVVGVSAAFAIDGATFLISALFASRLPALPPRGADVHSGDTGRQAGFRDGLRYLREDSYVLSLTSLKPLMQLYGGINALTPLYGTVVFAGISGPFYVGILYAIRGLGAAFGSLVLRAIFGDDARTLRRFIAVSFALGGASFAALAWCEAFWQACLAFFVSAIAQSAIWVSSGSLLQIEAEPRYHGRVFAIEFGVMTLVLASSSFAAGAAIDWGIPLSRVVSMFAALALLPLSLWTWTLWRRRSERES